jgi:hypothetical protein
VPARTDRESVRAETVTHVSGMKCYLCLRNRPLGGGSPHWTISTTTSSMRRQALGTILAVHGRVARLPHPSRYVRCGQEIGPKRRERATTRLSAARAIALPFATTRLRHGPRHSSLNAFTGLVRAARQAGPAQARRPMAVTIPRTAVQVPASSNCVP